MPRSYIWGVAASFLIALVSGCQTAPGVVRGQSPGDVPTYAAPGTQYPAPNAYAADGYAAPGNTDTCPYCGGNCRRGFCACRQFYKPTYCVPRNLSYPPPNTPPAVIQYPYYTCKGPDCFY